MTDTNRWPWALIEGVLKIDSNFTDRNFTDTPGEEGEERDEAVGYWLRLKMLTGNEASRNDQLYDLTDNPLDDREHSFVSQNQTLLI
jgi:hypothetical protein